MTATFRWASQSLSNNFSLAIESSTHLAAFPCTPSTFQLALKKI